jgi:hypothetical protein
LSLSARFSAFVVPFPVVDAVRTHVSLEHSPSGSGQINTALGSSPLWLLEILRNHVVDKGHHALVENDQVRDDRLSADPVLQRSLNVEMSLGESTVRNVARLPVRQVFVMRAIDHNEAPVKVAIKVLAPTLLGRTVRPLGEATVGRARLRAPAETVDHKVDRTVGPAATAIDPLGLLVPEGRPDREVIVQRVRLIAPRAQAKVAFKTVRILAAHGGLVLRRVATRNVRERAAPLQDGRPGRVSDLVGRSPRLGERPVLLAGNAQRVVLIA